LAVVDEPSVFLAHSLRRAVEDVVLEARADLASLLVGFLEVAELGVVFVVGAGGVGVGGGLARIRLGLAGLIALVLGLGIAFAGLGRAFLRFALAFALALALLLLLAGHGDQVIHVADDALLDLLRRLAGVLIVLKALLGAGHAIADEIDVFLALFF